MYINKILCDSPNPWQMGFQDPATPIMEGIINLHNDLFFLLTFIFFFVSWMLGRTIWFFNVKNNKTVINFSHGTLIEIIWTVIPSFIVIFIAIPSFALLYSMEEIIDPSITIKVIGRQWYWSYEYSDYQTKDNESISYDSYMVSDDDLKLGELRLLEVDNRVIVPIQTHLRVIITSGDVLHSWAIPSLGIKCDAVPGRLNQVNMFIKREGVFFGQCSELCGVNHGFMPIVVEAVSLKDYLVWLYNKAGTINFV
jgi:cytochrome c oxidase subunit 2